MISFLGETFEMIVVVPLFNSKEIINVATRKIKELLLCIYRRLMVVCLTVLSDVSCSENFLSSLGFNGRLWKYINICFFSFKFCLQ